MNTLKKIIAGHLEPEEFEALVALAEDGSGEAAGRRAGVSGQWVRVLAARARRRLATPEVREKLISECDKSCPSYYAPYEMPGALLCSRMNNRASEIMEIDSPLGFTSPAEISNPWGFQVRTEADMKRERDLMRDAEAAMIRRVTNGEEIISEEIEDLV